MPELASAKSNYWRQYPIFFSRIIDSGVDTVLSNWMGSVSVTEAHEYLGCDWKPRGEIHGASMFERLACRLLHDSLREI